MKYDVKCKQINFLRIWEYFEVYFMHYAYLSKLVNFTLRKRHNRHMYILIEVLLITIIYIYINTFLLKLST